MKKVRSMRAGDFWAPAGWGLFLVLLVVLIIEINGCYNIIEGERVTEQTVFWNQYKQALFASVLGQEQEGRSDDSLAAARIIGRYIRDKHAQGQSFKEVLEREEELRYLYRNVNNSVWSNSVKEEMTPPVMAMLTCPYWREMAQREWDRRVIEGLLSGELKTLPKFAESLPTVKRGGGPWWILIVVMVMQFSSFLLFLVVHSSYEKGNRWYQLPGGWPGRIAIFAGYFPGAWPLMTLASVYSLTVSLFRKRKDRQRDPVTPLLRNQEDLLNRLQARVGK